MPTKSLQLDGPNLEELLAQAMEAAPGGRVAAADRVRRGGLAGFFAREHFEVTVEFDDAAPDATHEGPADVPRSWSDLADVTEDVLELSASAGDGAASGVDAEPERAPAPQSEPIPWRWGDDGPAAPPPAAVTTVATLGEDADADLPSTQKASFAAMLASIARDTVADDVPPSPAVAPPPAPSAEPDRGGWIDAIADARPEPAPPLLAADLIPEAALIPEAETVSPEPLAVESADLVRPALSAVGLPGELLPDGAVLKCLETLSVCDDARAYVQLALTSALQRLPEAPPLPERAGSMVVAVGELDRALEFAAQVAARAGLDASSIVVASEARHRRGVAGRRLVCSPDEAAELAARSRRAPHMTIVALHAPVAAEPDRWANRMLQALEPTAVWGVAGATHKSEDVAAWADGLGGMDALALEDMSSTVSPARALATGIPVACLDGQRATPALWAALIASRLLVEQASRSAAGMDWS